MPRSSVVIEDVKNINGSQGEVMPEAQPRGSKRGSHGRDLDSPGPAIRKERRRQGMTVRELARRVGMTASHISRIERGLTNPTIGTLWRICDQLGVHLSLLFPAADIPDRSGIADRPQDEAAITKPEESGAGIVVDPRMRKRIEMPGIEWQKLTPLGDETLEFIECTYEVGVAEKEAYRHKGREYILVQKGCLLVEVGFSTYVLKPGFSAAFNSSVPHRFSNIGDEPAVAIWVITDFER